VVEALKEEHPWFAHAYDHHYLAFEQETIHQQNEVRKSLDALIQSLKAGRL
jgi:hypothetical protein